MKLVRNLTLGAAALAMVTVSAVPASADWNGWGGYRHHDHDHAGAIVAGILGIGLLAAIASSGSDHSAPPPQSAPLPPPPLQNGPQNYAPGQNAPQSYGPQPMQGQIVSENDAVDACASAAEQEGGRFASVRAIRDVRSVANGWDVKGAVEQRSSYRDAGVTNGFKCQVRYGAIQSVRIDGATTN